MAFTYEFPRPGLTVDCAAFAFDGNGLELLLIQRAHAPFEGAWALPGGFVDANERLEDAARRELAEETGVTGLDLEQCGAFGDPGRDPRGHTVSVVFVSLVPRAAHEPRAASDARAARWFSTSHLPSLAFDHDRIVTAALDRLAERAQRTPIGFDLMPPAFPLSQLQRLYAAILRQPVDVRRLRQVLQSLSLVLPTDQHVRGPAGRRERLYRFNRGAYIEHARRGYHLDPLHLA